MSDYGFLVVEEAREISFHRPAPPRPRRNIGLYWTAFRSMSKKSLPSLFKEIGVPE
jgi:hypothetical protein